MPVDRSYVAENDAERERLRTLLLRLSDRDLELPMEAGWTVAGVLAHLAFLGPAHRGAARSVGAAGRLVDTSYRRRARRGLDQRRDEAALPGPRPPAAAELALSVAETVDRRVALVSEAILEANARGGPVLNWRRAVHRREHLDEIESALRTRRA